MAWRWNSTQELPYVRRAWTEDADSTITSPTTTRAVITAARSTKTAGGLLERGFARVALSGPRRVRTRGRARTRSVAAGMGLLGESLGDGAAEVVAPFGVGPVPVERGAARREHDAVAGLGGIGGGPDGRVHRRGHGDRAHPGEGGFDLGARLPYGDHGAHVVGTFGQRIESQT